MKGVPEAGRPKAACNHFRVSDKVCVLYSTPMCSTPGEAVARRAVPSSKRP